MTGSSDIDPGGLGEQVDSLAAIDQLRQIAERVPAYLVGGVVRDLLLGREVADLDVAIDEEVRGAGRTSRASAWSVGASS